MKTQLVGRPRYPGKDLRQKEKGLPEDEIDIWYHQLNGHEFEQTLGDSGDQRSWCAAVHGVVKNQT